MSQSKSKKLSRAVSAPSAKSESKESPGRPAPAVTYGNKAIRLSLIGVALIALGMLLMLGGAMPSPDVWDESLIYSTRRMVVAPILIIAGLILQAVAIFKV